VTTWPRAFPRSDFAIDIAIDFRIVCGNPMTLVMVDPLEER
jgi:hypothetical protein